MFEREWRTLAGHLLELAAEEFSNHGCNDFNLDTVGLSHAAQVEVVTRSHEWNGDPEEIPQAVARLPYVSDFVMMIACHHWLLEKPLPRRSA